MWHLLTHTMIQLLVAGNLFHHAQNIPATHCNPRLSGPLCRYYQMLIPVPPLTPYREMYFKK